MRTPPPPPPLCPQDEEPPAEEATVVLSPEQCKEWVANKGFVAGVNGGNKVNVQCLQCLYKTSSPALMRRHCGPESKSHPKSSLTGDNFFNLMETGTWTFDDLAAHAAPPAPDEAAAPPKRAPSISVCYWLGLTNTISDAADVQRQHKVAETSKGGVAAFLGALKTQGAALLDGAEGERRQKFKVAIANHIIAKKNEGGGAFCGQAIIDAWPHSDAFAAYREGVRRYRVSCCQCPGAECTCPDPVAGSSAPGFPALPTMDDDGKVFNFKEGVAKLQQQIGNLRGRYRVRFFCALHVPLSPAPPPPHGTVMYSPTTLPLYPFPAGREDGERRHGRR